MDLEILINRAFIRAFSAICSSNGSESSHRRVDKRCAAEERLTPIASNFTSTNTAAAATNILNNNNNPNNILKSTPATITANRNRMLRKRYDEDIDKQEQRIVNFMEDLDKLGIIHINIYIVLYIM